MLKGQGRPFSLTKVLLLSIASVAYVRWRAWLRRRGPAVAEPNAQPPAVSVGHQQVAVTPQFEPVARLITMALQFNTILVALLIAFEWLRWSGYFNYFALTPDEIGMPPAWMVIQGVLDYLPVGVVLMCLVLVERARARNPDQLRYPATMAFLVVAATMTGIYPNKGPRATWIDIAFAMALNAATAILGAVIAAALVRRTTRLYRLGIVASLLVASVGGYLSYTAGRSNAERTDELAPQGGTISAPIFPIPRRFVEGVRVRGVNGAPSGCGLLLGTGNGSHYVYYPSPNSKTLLDVPGARGIWRLPVDSAVLEHC